MLRRGLLAVALLVLAAPVTAHGAKPSGTYNPEFQTLSFATGTRAGTVLSGSSLTLAPSGLAPFAYVDPHGAGEGTGTYDSGTWTSAWQTTRAPYTQAVASWIAATPAGTWVQIEFRARTADAHETKWYVLGRWTYGDADFHRTSLSGQGDADGFVAIDTFVAAKKREYAGYQLRLTLLRRAGTTATPTVSRLSIVASDMRTAAYVPSATTMGGQSVVLDVPRYSQEIHVGHYPQFDNGGEAWCSPTSTAMVVDYWKSGPSPADYAWVLADDPGHADPWVDHAARYTYDYNYQGAGNWPFNVAYAGHFGLTGAVMQLRSLAEAEQFVKAGIPLVISIAFGSGKLDNFPFKSTNGHLTVIAGFTGDGNVVANEPAALTDAEVRRTYDRAQFEQAWLEATGGIAYVIHPVGHPVPTL